MVLFSGLWSRSLAYNEAPLYPGTSSNNNDATYGSIPQHSEPSLTRDYEQGVWSPLQSCLFYVFIYFASAVIAYSYVFEKWPIVDSLYFAVATFTTVGYGDVEPSTQPGQFFTIFFACYGVIILGVFIGIFGHSVSEAQARTIKKWKRKKESKLLKILFSDYESRRKKEADTQAIKETFISDHQLLWEDIRQVCWDEYPQILIVMFLALILGYREGWTLTSTMYFCIMSASTTGFGDYTPQTAADKIYCIFFFPISVAVFGEVLGKIAGVYIEHKFRKAEQQFLKRAITLCDIKNMDADSNGEVDLGEFLSFMLVALQKVDQDSMDELKALFSSLDTDGNGVLNHDDLVELTEASPLTEIQEEIIEGEIASEELAGLSDTTNSDESMHITEESLLNPLNGIKAELVSTAVPEGS